MKILICYEIRFFNMKIKSSSIALRKSLSTIFKTEGQLKASYYFLVIKFCDTTLNMTVEYDIIMWEVYEKNRNLVEYRT
jgi:hypothetical protein